jgi:chloramphenicol O-acetyltransferase type A
MRAEVNIDKWKRKDQYHFFKTFDEPFFGVTVKIDCTHTYAYAKENNVSFFLYYLYLSLKAANKVDALKLRMVDDKVYLYDTVHASPTINRPNGTFGFSYIDYYEDFDQYYTLAQQEVNKVQNSVGLVPAISGENVIHYSTLPWLDFTAISHARSFSFKDSCPKITFGKMVDDGSSKYMAMSVHAHHALVDGVDVGRYVEEIEGLMIA